MIWVHMAQLFVYSVPMSTAWVECWKCDECGFRWIKTEVWPERCPSRKCRKRSWNKDGERAATGPEGKVLADAAGAILLEKFPELEVVTPPKIDMAALRAICGGEMHPGRLHPDDSLGRQGTAGHGSGLGDVEPVEICAHLEWVDGEQYRCRLAAGHKGKCQPGERVSA